MTGLCRLIRGCAAQTAGPFVPPGERRKLAVLIPLFMSSREKKASTLQPCPLHPFRGQEEGAPALSPRCRGSPGPVKHCKQGWEKGLLCGSLDGQLPGNGGNSPTTEDSGWGGGISFN